MGKGRGKKGKRGGKPGRGPAIARRPEAVAVKPPSAPAPPPERSEATPTSPAPRMAAAVATATPQAAPRELGGATAGWRPWLRHLGVKIGVYALFLLGLYWLAAAYFAWYGELNWVLGAVPMGVLGLVCLALGWYLLGPETSQQGGKDANPCLPKNAARKGSSICGEAPGGWLSCAGPCRHYALSDRQAPEHNKDKNRSAPSVA